MGDVEFFLEEFADVFFREVHCRRDDMKGFFAAKLNDEFAEVGFYDLDGIRLQVLIQFYFLRRHGFALDDGADVVVPDDPVDDGPCLDCILGPVHLPATRQQIPFQLLEKRIKAINCVVFPARCE